MRKAIGRSAGSPANLLDQLLKMHRPRSRGARRQAEAQRAHELFELHHLERFGRLVNPIERRHPVRLEVCGDGLVRQEHELFDQTVRDVPLRRNDVLDESFLVQHDLGLRQVEVDRSATLPPAVQHFEERAHQLEQRHQRPVLCNHRRIAVRQDRIDGRVRHSGVASDDAVVQFMSNDLSLWLIPPSGRTERACPRAG